MVYNLSVTIDAGCKYLSIKGNVNKFEMFFREFLNSGRGSLTISEIEEITYRGNKLETLTKKLINYLGKQGLDIKIIESDFKDAEIDIQEQVPYRHKIAKFTDNNMVEGSVEIRVTGPHNNGTFRPLIDVMLNGTKKCEEELFGHYSGLPTSNDFEDIVNRSS